MNNLTSDAAEIMELEFGEEPGYQALLSEQRVRSEAAKAIYDARIAAGLTQKQLADLIGTRQSVISRLETPTTTGTHSRSWSGSRPRCTSAWKCNSSRNRPRSRHNAPAVNQSFPARERCWCAHSPSARRAPPDQGIGSMRTWRPSIALIVTR